MKRARNTIQKEERRAVILEAGWQLFVEEKFSDISMNWVAREAGLAKGTLYLYFETKEELFLTLLTNRMALFFQELDVELLKFNADVPIKELSRFIGRFLAQRPSLVRLMGISHALLEHNAKDEAVIAFKMMTRSSVLQSGEIIESLLPFLKIGEGASLIMAIYTILLGVQQMTDPAPNIVALLEREPELSFFKIDFESYLAYMIETHLKGVVRPSLKNNG